MQPTCAYMLTRIYVFVALPPACYRRCARKIARVFTVYGEPPPPSLFLANSRETCEQSIPSQCLSLNTNFISLPKVRSLDWAVWRARVIVTEPAAKRSIGPEVMRFAYPRGEMEMKYWSSWTHCWLSTQHPILAHGIATGSAVTVAWIWYISTSAYRHFGHRTLLFQDRSCNRGDRDLAKRHACGPRGAALARPVVVAPHPTQASEEGHWLLRETPISPSPWSMAALLSRSAAGGPRHVPEVDRG